MKKTAGILALVCVGLALAACAKEKDNNTAAIAVVLAATACNAPTFNESASVSATGNTQYTSQCSGCHGTTGNGGTGPSLHGCASCGTYQGLAARIHCTMPQGSSSSCVDNCARDIAKYIRTNFL